MISCPSIQSQFVIMAKKNVIKIACMKVHRPTKAILIHLAVGALPCFHPSTVAEGLETVFPNVKKIVLIDIALRKATVDVGTSGNRAVDEDGPDRDACAAEIEPVADLALVRADVGLATELTVYLPFFSGRDDEIHQLAKLFITELQTLVSSGATNRIDGE